LRVVPVEEVAAVARQRLQRGQRGADALQRFVAADEAAAARAQSLTNARVNRTSRAALPAAGAGTDSCGGPGGERCWRRDCALFCTADREPAGGNGRAPSCRRRRLRRLPSTASHRPPLCVAASKQSRMASPGAAPLACLYHSLVPWFIAADCPTEATPINVPAALALEAWTAGRLPCRASAPPAELCVTWQCTTSKAKRYMAWLQNAVAGLTVTRRRRRCRAGGAAPRQLWAAGMGRTTGIGR